MANINTIFCTYENPDPDAASLNDEMLRQDYGNVLSYIHGRDDDVFHVSFHFAANALRVSIKTPHGDALDQAEIKFRDIRDHVEMYLGTIESMQRTNLSDLFAIASMDELRRNQHNEMADILRDKMESIGIEISADAPKESRNFHRDVLTMWIENMAYSQEKTNKPSTTRRNAFSVIRRTNLF